MGRYDARRIHRHRYGAEASRSGVTPLPGEVLVTSEGALAVGDGSRAGGHVVGFTRGATLPANPEDGDQHYDTVDHLLYFYDGGRSKWLSVEMWSFGFGRNGNQAVSSYLRLFGTGIGSATAGYRTLHPMTIVGWSYSGDTSGTFRVEMRDNGTQIAGADIDVGLQASAGDTTLNADIDFGRIFSLFNDATGLIPARHAILVYMRRRA